jgi:6-phosphofructokinase 2
MIVTLTLNPAVDKSSSVDTVASEIKLRCSAPTYHPGGGGVNVSRAIKKVGGDSLAVYVAGGSVGETLRDLLSAEGIRQQVIPSQAWTRENLIVFENTTTLQYRFGMPGLPLQEAEVRACVDAVLAHDADYVVASGSLPPAVPDDFYAQLAHALRGTRTRLIVDTSGEALAAMKGANCYLLKPNINELEQLSNEKFDGEEHLIRTAQRLIAEGMAQVLVVSLGASGALMVSADDVAHLRPPVVPIKSKVGAGDSMVGGLTWALAQGRDLVDAVRYGIACGTACVMTEGTELCRLEDVTAIYPRVKVLRD